MVDARVSERSGRLLVDGELVGGTVVFAEGGITQVRRDSAVAADAPIVAPGLVDLHVHGFGGHGPLDDLGAMAAALARAGTTTFQPTLFPDEPARLGRAVHAVHAAAAHLGAGAAHVAGVHLEGPFVNPARAGALPVERLAAPSPAALAALLEHAADAADAIRTMTLAPELPGAPDLVAALVGAGVRVSLGHSEASAAQARAAARAGACSATHLFNAMGPWHHREVGLVGFALGDDALHAELIGDLRHVGADAIELALAARGVSGLCLVSDALAVAGTGCEVFHGLGRDHHVEDGGVYFRGEDGVARLAGSAMSQLEMVRRLAGAGVVSLADALTMASRTPAAALGAAGRFGVLAEGARADLIVLDGPDLLLREVVVGGASVDPTAALA